MCAFCHEWAPRRRLPEGLRTVCAEHIGGHLIQELGEPQFGLKLLLQQPQRLSSTTAAACLCRAPPITQPNPLRPCVEWAFPGGPSLLHLWIALDMRPYGWTPRLLPTSARSETSPKRFLALLLDGAVQDGGRSGAPALLAAAASATSCAPAGAARAGGGLARQRAYQLLQPHLITTQRGAGNSIRGVRPQLTHRRAGCSIHAPSGCVRLLKASAGRRLTVYLTALVLKSSVSLLGNPDPNQSQYVSF